MAKKAPALAPVQSIQFADFLRDIADSHKLRPKDRFCFLLGAGASISSGIPTGSDLVERWLVELHDFDPSNLGRQLGASLQAATSGGPFLLPSERMQLKKWANASITKHPGLEGFTWEQRAHYYGNFFNLRFGTCLANGQASLLHLMETCQPSPGYLYLARIMLESRHNVVVTTNFDRLVEDAVSIVGHRSALSLGHEKVAQYLKTSLSIPAIAKVHGDIFHDTYNAPEDISGLRSEWQHALTSIFGDFSPIVLGYGGNDPGLMDFLSSPDVERIIGQRLIYWCYHESGGFPTNPLIARIPRSLIRFVPTPDFDKAVRHISDAFQFPMLHEQIKQRMEQSVLSIRFAEDSLAKRLATPFRARPQVNGLAELQTIWKLFPAIALQNEFTDAESERQTEADVRALRDADVHQVELAKQSSGLSVEQWRDVIGKIAFAQPRHELIKNALEDTHGDPAMHAVLAVFLALEHFGDERPLAIASKALATLSSMPKERSWALSAMSCGAIAAMNGADSSAMQYFQAAREWFISNEGPSGLNTIASTVTLGVSASQFGAGDVANQCYREITEAVIKELPDVPLSVGTLVAFSRLTMSLEGPECARQRSISAITLSHQVLGQSHPSTLVALTILADSLRASAHYDQAKSIFAFLLPRVELVMGHSHAVTIQVLNGSGLVEAALGRFEPAKRLLRRAFDALRQTLGAKHPMTLTVFANLGWIEFEQGHLATATDHAKAAFDCADKELGTDHRCTLQALANLSLCIHEHRYLDQAEHLYRITLERRRRAQGDSDPETLMIMNNLAMCLHELGKTDEARTLLHVAIEKAKKSIGDTHPTTELFDKNLQSLP